MRGSGSGLVGLVVVLVVAAKVGLLSDITTASSSGSLASVPPAGHAPARAHQAYTALRHEGFTRSQAIELTAIAGVESGWNPKAMNTNAGTGDYSVGDFQINYFGSLRAGRTKAFGSPEHLYGNLAAQAHGAWVLFRWDRAAGGSGFGPWMPDITSGKAQAFMAQAEAAAR